MERLMQKDVQHADAVAMTLLSHTLELSGHGMIALTKNGRVLLISPHRTLLGVELYGKRLTSQKP
jgi:hypothetical protein